MRDKSFSKLCFEALLFSVLMAVGFHSWVVFALMLFVLALLISRPKGIVYMVISMSLLWGYVAASIGYSFGGWLGAGILGVFFLIKGMQIHWKKLELSWVDLDFGVNNAVNLRSNWYIGRQNLN